MVVRAARSRHVRRGAATVAACAQVLPVGHRAGRPARRARVAEFEIRLRSGRALLALTEEHPELQEPFPRCAGARRAGAQGAGELHARQGARLQPAGPRPGTGAGADRRPRLRDRRRYVQGHRARVPRDGLARGPFAALPPAADGAPGPPPARRRKPAEARAELIRAGATMTVSLDELRRQLESRPARTADSEAAMNTTPAPPAEDADRILLVDDDADQSRRPAPYARRPRLPAVRDAQRRERDRGGAPGPSAADPARRRDAGHRRLRDVPASQGGPEHPRGGGHLPVVAGRDQGQGARARSGRGRLRLQAVSARRSDARASTRTSPCSACAASSRRGTPSSRASWRWRRSCSPTRGAASKARCSATARPSARCANRSPATPPMRIPSC